MKIGGPLVLDGPQIPACQTSSSQREKILCCGRHAGSDRRRATMACRKARHRKAGAREPGRANQPAPPPRRTPGAASGSSPVRAETPQGAPGGPPGPSRAACPPIGRDAQPLLLRPSLNHHGRTDRPNRMQGSGGRDSGRSRSRRGCALDHAVMDRSRGYRRRHGRPRNQASGCDPDRRGRNCHRDRRLPD